MQVVFGVNIVALVDGQPKTLNLFELLECFLKHRQEIVTRRSLFELRKARERSQTLEGMAALANIDEIVELIKTSKTPVEARERLTAKLWSPGSVVEKMIEEVRSANTNGLESQSFE